jgi:hypothetical protein
MQYTTQENKSLSYETIKLISLDIAIKIRECSL